MTKARNTRLLNEFGITERQWNRMYKLQKGLCPICLKQLPGLNDKYNRRAAPVDHDHKSKRVRGLVCLPCNRWRVGINTTETAKRLVRYLESECDGRNL